MQTKLGSEVLKYFEVLIIREVSAKLPSSTDTKMSPMAGKNKKPPPPPPEEERWDTGKISLADRMKKKNGANLE